MAELKHWVRSLLLVVCCVEAAVSWCSPGWYTWRDSCYLPLEGQHDWDTAKDMCKDRGGLLLVQNSAEEHDVIMKLRDQWFGHASWIPLWIDCEVYNQTLHCPRDRGNGSLSFINWAGTSDKVYTTTERKCLNKGGSAVGDMFVNLCTRKYMAICESRNAECVSLGADGRVPQRCLSGHSLQNLTVKSLAECSRACLLQPQCHSFNLCYGGLQKMCQLNKVRRSQVSQDDFIPQGKCIYFDL